MRNGERGFTLIELLIVVAIIAILALIAVPNFLEAQTRAKVSRVKSDLRTISVAVEAYGVDAGDYPRNFADRTYTVSLDLTTPIAYLSSADMLDPFALYKEKDPLIGFPYYSYHHILFADNIYPPPPMIPEQYWPPEESTDGPPGFGNRNATLKYGQWRLLSIGPDRAYLPPDWRNYPRDQIFRLIETLYDPSNGTISFGNISRTQLHPDGIVQYTGP
jgi:prepilin-type N-terminal cleavage/methylation domain-containing protein